MQCFAVLFFLIVFIAWLGERNNISRSKRSSSSQKQDERYFEQLFVLDAAEHGFFVPGAEKVFEYPDEAGDGDDYYQYEQDQLDEPDPNEGIW
jgi:hypothetical protein